MLLSPAWAPLARPRRQRRQRAFLYLGALVGGALPGTRAAAARAVEPALAAGDVDGRRLRAGRVAWCRGWCTCTAPRSAGGRLEQPLTYWNGMGALAAIGVVLCARLAGDDDADPAAARRRRGRRRAAGIGLYLTFSRGAVFACAAGLVVLAIAAPTRAQLRGGAVAVLAAVAGAAAAAPFAGVTHLSGGSRNADGAVALVLVAAIALVAVLVERGRVRAGGGPLVDRRLSAAALGALAGARGGGRAASRCSWRWAATRAAGRRPSTPAPSASPRCRATATTTGASPGGCSSTARWPARAPAASLPNGWRKRPFAEGAHDAHSLYIETAAELGLVGLLLLAGFLGGVAFAARQAHGVAPALAAGPMAGAAVWAAHVAVDWDWEMPAATLPVIVLAGLLLAVAAPRRA